MPFRLTTVATFRTPTSAWMARNYLSTFGIRAFVIDEHISTCIWTWGNAAGWTKVQVEAEFEHAAYNALKGWREARDLLLSVCEDRPLEPGGPPLPPPCMDRKPVTAAEGHQRKMNGREDLARRAKLAAVFALIMVGNAVGLPGQWARLSGLPGIFVELAGLGLLGYSTWLLWAVSTSPGTLRPMYQRDLFWGRCMNAIIYLLLALTIIYVVMLSQ
jgi:hypothetical protein